MAKLDWQQLREHKCPRCKGDLVAKSLLESLWSCVCGFEITGEQFDGVIAQWIWTPSKKRKPAIVEVEPDSEEEEPDDDILKE